MKEIDMPGYGRLVVNELAPMRGLQLQARVMRHLKGALAAGGEMTGSDLGMALLTDVPPEDLPGFLAACLQGTTAFRRDGDTVSKFDLTSQAEIDKAFAGKWTYLLSAAVAAIASHFADFSGGSANDRTAPPTPTP